MENRAEQSIAIPVFNQIHSVLGKQIKPISILITLTPISQPFISNMKNAESSSNKRASTFNINDHSDILIEILTRLDDSSLSAAACVCRLWCSITRNEAFWEMLCFRHSSFPPRLRQVVVALGGYKKLYMVCMRRCRRRRSVVGSEMSGWTREEVQLWLSLFCVDCYERLGGKKVAGGDGLMPSLIFLRCEPVNV